MQILFSPAKKMRRDADTLPPAGLPRYLEQADRLRAYLKELPYEELKRLLACNDAIAQLNYRRYQTMDLRRDLTPAILAYDGIAYQYMAPQVFERPGLTTSRPGSLCSPACTGFCVLWTG